MNKVFVLVILLSNIAHFHYCTSEHINCLSDGINDCESRRIKVVSEFYICDGFLEFPDIIDRIGVNKDNIAAKIGDEVFVVDKNTMKQKDEIINITESGNENVFKFYATKETFPFITVHGKTLMMAIQFLPDRKVGKLYTISIDKFDQVQRKKIEGIKDVTDFFFETTAKSLFLGVKTNIGGKLLKLKHVTKDPCLEDDTHVYKLRVPRQAELKSKKIKDASELLRKDDVDIGDNNLDSLQKENMMLKKELDLATRRFNTFVTKMKSYKSVENPKIDYARPKCYATIEQNKFEDSVCVPKTEYENLMTLISTLRSDNIRISADYSIFKTRTNKYIDELLSLVTLEPYGDIKKIAQYLD